MKKDGGYLLPATINPPQVGICICIPCDRNHALAFLGQLNELTYWSVWQRDDAHTAKDAARVWMDILDDASRQLNECGVFDMTSPCGCDHEGRQFRINEDGEYQYSDDGGVTWIDAPELDPRNNSIQFPPVGAASETSRCKAARNIVSQMQSQLADFVDNLSAFGTLAAIVGSIISIAAVFLSGGTLAPVVAAFAVVMLNAGDTAVAAAFTSTVWDDLHCAIFCNIGDDGSVTDAQISSILEQAADTITGLAYTIIEHWFSLYGSVGLSNMGAVGNADGDDCDECGCDCTLETATVLEFRFQAALPGGFFIPPGWDYEGSGTLVSTGILLDNPGEYLKIFKEDGTPVRVIQSATYGETTVGTDCGVIVRTDDAFPTLSKVCTNPNGNVWQPLGLGGRLSTGFRSTLCDCPTGAATISLWQLWVCPE